MRTAKKGQEVELDLLKGNSTHSLKVFLGSCFVSKESVLTKMCIKGKSIWFAMLVEIERLT